MTLRCPGFVGKRLSIKCLNGCLSSDENGLSSYLACLRPCDDEDEDGDEDDNVSDNDENIDSDESSEDENDENVGGDDNDVFYY